MRIKLDRAERMFLWWPFVGAPETPQIRIGDGDWQAMELDGSYEPDPVVEDADWYRVMVAGPDATDNPAGTIPLTGFQRVRFKVEVDGGEIDIQPDSDPIWLEITR